MTDEEKHILIQRTLGKMPKKRFENFSPTTEEFIKNSWLKNKKRWKNNRRLNKKFKANPLKYITKTARREFLAMAFSLPISRRLDYGSIAKRCLSVEFLPSGFTPSLMGDII